MSEISWESLVRSADSEIDEPEYVYEFSGGGSTYMSQRRFYDSGDNNGVYEKE